VENGIRILSNLSNAGITENLPAAMYNLAGHLLQGCQLCKEPSAAPARSNENAVYDSAQQLEKAVPTLAYLANECDEDIKKRCSNV
jgi:hypothetical protein